MPYELIAEYPSALASSATAIRSVFERVCKGEFTGRTILLSGQSYEADGEQYLMFDATYRDGIFKFENPIPDPVLIADAVRIAPDRVVADNEERSLKIRSATAEELARFLDYMYRVVFQIKLLPRTDSYNFVAEAEAK